MQWIKPHTNFDFVGRMPFFGVMSVVVALLSILSIPLIGFNWGIDFAGGTEIQLRFDKEVQTPEIRKVLDGLGFEKNEVQPYGDAASHEYLVRIERVTSLTEERVGVLREAAIKRFTAGTLRTLTFQPEQGDRLLFDFAVKAPAVEAASQPAGAPADGVSPAAALSAMDEQLRGLRTGLEEFFKQQAIELRERDAIQMGQPHNNRVEALVYFKGVSDRITAAMTKQFGTVEARRTEYVDSNVSRELRTDGLLAILYALVVMLIYVAIRFDIYSAPGAIIALIHDISITAGFFAWSGLEFNLQTVAALLTILGYSINDTIVVYDRIRETLPPDEKIRNEAERATFVNRAVNDTLSRTILTSFVTMLVVLSLDFFATGAVQGFAFALSIGFVVGTYSSVFVATATYVFLKKTFPAKPATR